MSTLTKPLEHDLFLWGYAFDRSGPLTLRQRVSFVVLSLAVLLSSFVLIYCKDLDRRLFIKYQGVQHAQQQLVVQRSKLLLEKQAWLRQAAHTKLLLKQPDASEFMLVKI